MNRKTMPTLLLLGCGQLGTALGLRYLERGWQVVGACRHPEKLPAGFVPLALDFTRHESLADLLTVAPDYIVLTLSPSSRTEASYQAIFVDAVQNLLTHLDCTVLKRLFFASSTSVYHQNNGEWVDEKSPTQPTGYSGRAVLTAESLLTDAGLPVTSIRFGGIYGGSQRLLDQVRQGACAPAKPEHYSNRIHREDCVQVLAHLIGRAEQGQTLSDCYVAVDDNPAPIAEVHQWLAAQLGIACVVDPNYRHMTGSKRCSNERLKDTGFQFLYPDYRAGYAGILEKLL